MEKAPAIDAVFGDVLRNVFDHVDRSHSLLPGRAHKNPCGNKILDWLVLDNLGNHSVFEQAVMPHLPAAYNLARWLTRNDHDAEDLVQEAYLRAYKFFNRFQGDDGRARLLAVVRNTCYTGLKQHRAREMAASFDETIHGAASDALNPEKLLLQK